MTLRTQPAYGMPLDPSSTATAVDIPETESWFFLDQIDPYRGIASAAHMTGKPLISLECCPTLLPLGNGPASTARSGRT